MSSQTMAMGSEFPEQQTRRDLRSEHQDYKRAKDAKVKWSRGSRPQSGCYLVCHPTETEVVRGSNDAHRAKVRPYPSDTNASPTRKYRPNVNKPRGRSYMIRGNQHAMIHARNEIRGEEGVKSTLTRSDSTTTDGGFGLGASDDFTYSFDRTKSPGQPLSLESFVRTDGRATERMLRWEYEILDANGEVMKGRKARKNLRGRHDPGVEIDEDDFELV